jgi:hypothetical protein
MTQASYTIDNKAGALVRADLNALAAAIQSGNSGATAPTDTRGGMVWVDTSTTPATLRIRNVADNAWIAVGALDSTFAVAGLVQLTQAQAEDAASTVFGTVSGQRLAQAVVQNVPALTQAQAENPASTVFGAVSGQRLAQAVSVNVTASAVLSATAGATAGSVGSYAFLGVAANVTSQFGETRAGSELHPAGMAAGQSFANNFLISINNAAGQNSARAGTWRCMGVVRSSATPVFGASLWLRIS